MKSFLWSESKEIRTRINSGDTQKYCKRLIVSKGEMFSNRCSMFLRRCLQVSSAEAETSTESNSIW